MLKEYILHHQPLSNIPEGKLLISTINAHSYNVAEEDVEFKHSLTQSDILLPDGISIVWAYFLLTGKKFQKIAGEDLFLYEMTRLNKINGKAFFLGSNETTLQKIKQKAEKDYPNVNIKGYSPPFVEKFSEEENLLMIQKINDFQPDVLFIGMTAPKQEKWAHQHFNQLNVKHVCSIGAVFDFYSGNRKRAPRWVIRMGIEWLYRLVREPQRLWKRYLIGNWKFIKYILKERFNIRN